MKLDSKVTAESLAYYVGRLAELQREYDELEEGWEHVDQSDGSLYAEQCKNVESKINSLKKKISKLRRIFKPMIGSFNGRYRFLSNFYMCPVEYQGIVYPSSEHAYQAAKTLDVDARQKIAALETANESKKAGQIVEKQPGWEEMKVQVMEEIVLLKFQQNGDLRLKLLGTGLQELVEGNTWHDTFWGVCHGGRRCSCKSEPNGRNELGQILMRVRTQLSK